MKRITFTMLGITLVLFLGLGFFTKPTIANTANREESERDIYLNIMTCNKAQYEMVKAIVGDRHNIESMFFNEKDSKEFKYTDETISNISNMDLFFYSGNSFEPWSNELIDKLKKGNLGIINISRGIRTITMQKDKTSIDNPYYWTGLEEYKIALYNVKSAIQDRDPKNRSVYEDNYNKAVKALEDKIKVFNNKNDALKEYTFIALDDNMDYFYKTVGITPIKLSKDKSLEEVIKDNKIDKAKLIVLKDRETEFTLQGYKVVNLDRYNENKSSEEVLLENLNSFYEVIPNLENK